MTIFSCARAPFAFKSSVDPVWKQIEMKDGIDFDYAWKNVVDITSRRYDIEFMSKEDGYIRTAMIYYLSKYGNAYGVRVSIKFDMPKRLVSIQTYAQFHKEFGYDQNILNDVYNDINGIIGRSIK
jgi:hypothetical protein